MNLRRRQCYRCRRALLEAADRVVLEAAGRVVLEAADAVLEVAAQEEAVAGLTADEKKKVQEHLKGLTDKDEISDDEAKTRLDKLLALMEGKKETMEAAGYRWPGAGGGGGPRGGGGGGGPPQPPANPFKDGDP